MESGSCGVNKMFVDIVAVLGEAIMGNQKNAMSRICCYDVLPYAFWEDEL